MNELIESVQPLSPAWDANAERLAAYQALEAIYVEAGGAAEDRWHSAVSRYVRAVEDTYQSDDAVRAVLHAPHTITELPIPPEVAAALDRPTTQPLSPQEPK